MSNNILNVVEDHIYGFYKENATSNNIYHNLTHVKNVVKSAELIGQNLVLDENDLEVVLIAAWFHDIGYLESTNDHENTSCTHAEQFLLKHNYSKENIKKVKKCILATKMPHKPNNIIEEIICDADISHIGTKEFFDLSELLRLEIEKTEKRNISDFEWLEINIDFLTNNRFFTKYAKENFEERKNNNLLKLKKKYKKKVDKKKDRLAKEEKLAFDKEKLAIKNLDSKKADRGIETMFRNVLRTHVSFSSMADNKANIMISVNTLLLGAIFTVLAGKLDANPHLIIPTLVLTIVSLVTLIISIRVTRPSISSGVFTKDDIKNKTTNLLFFGNFYRMNLEDFNWGMQEMMNDKDFLYGSMIKDFYYLGQVLGEKYKLLRLAYTFFIYGITASAILFTLFIWLYPSNTAVENLIE